MHHLDHDHPLTPSVFCWTKFGTEAGEAIEEILQRKEAERRANVGVFFWGIGNSVAPALAKALGDRPALDVLFSPMRSRPRLVDTSPSRIIEWRAGTTLRGDPFMLPSNARVTSHGDSDKRVHYALVCRSEQPLLVGDGESVDAGSLVNLLSGNRVGSSQVTSVVRQVRTTARPLLYPVALRAQLVAPYFVRLSETSLDKHQLAA